MLAMLIGGVVLFRPAARSSHSRLQRWPAAPVPCKPRRLWLPALYNASFFTTSKS